MIRLAKQTDIDDVEKIFNEILDTPEMVRTTNWLKDGYPTRADAQKALDAGTLYVGEDETGGLYGAVNLNHIQPPEYAKIPWKSSRNAAEMRCLSFIRFVYARIVRVRAMAGNLWRFPNSLRGKKAVGLSGWIHMRGIDRQNRCIPLWGTHWRAKHCSISIM